MRTDPIPSRRDPYAALVGDGHYDRPPQGLWGKHDHVRRMWENQTSRFAVRGAITDLATACRHQDRGLRVIDLGCGSGEGWNLLTGIPGPAPGDRSARLLNGDSIARYHGVDLSPEMVLAAVAQFAQVPAASFSVGDLGQPDRVLRPHAPFDLYYNCFASLSHLDDGQLRELVLAVLRHQAGPCALVVDVHGQYSPEWPGRWGSTLVQGAPRMQPYSMSWMYPPEERQRRRQDFDSCLVRYWGGRELASFLRSIPGVAGRLRRMSLHDRSVLVGRHADTGEYNAGLRPTRHAVNHLLEFNRWPDWDALAVDPLPTADDPEVEAFLTSFREAWNSAVGWFRRLLDDRDHAARLDRLCCLPMVDDHLRAGLQAIAAQRGHLAWFEPGDPGANLLQPQFALWLRQLEWRNQRGLGCGHGLVAVLELGPEP